MRLPNLLASRPGRLITFFFLYVTEGIPLGFTATAIATQMRRQGVGAGDISIFVGTLYLPWAWKWLVGPIIDVVYSDRLGRRRAWIVAMQVLMSAALLCAMPIDFSTELRLFTVVILAVNAFGATQDVAIDALACGVLEEDERGLANGLMFAGAYVGQALGGSGVLFLTGWLKFNATFIFVVGCILSVTVFVALPLREPASSPAEGAEDADSPSLRRAFGKIARYVVEAARAFFGTRAAVAGLVFALLPSGAYALSLALQPNLAVELGLSDRQIGLLALVSSLVSGGCCVLGGWLSDRFGRRRTLALYVIGTTLPTVWLAAVMQQHGWVMPVDPRLPSRPVPPGELVAWFWAAVIGFSVFQGLLYGTRTALFMDIATVDVAATQFTAYMALMNVAIWYTATWQGWTIDALGYPSTLMLDAAAGLLCLAPLPFIYRRQPRADAAAAAQLL